MAKIYKIYLTTKLKIRIGKMIRFQKNATKSMMNEDCFVANCMYKK